MTSSGRKDATESEGACTICTEMYRDPRLLPCRHTFCSGCLERWHASSPQRNYFSCPICREEVWLPEHGVQGFSSNYFVPCKKYKDSCSVCQTSNVGVLKCNSCDQLLCQTCRKAHGSNQGSEGDGSCCHDYEEEIVPEEATALRTAISMLRPVTRSCCYAEVIGGFQCMEEGHDTCVSKIVPVSARDAWVLLDNGPVIYRYNMNGKVTERRYATGKVIDMCVHPDGPLLVIQDYSNSVFVCGDMNSKPIEYVNVGDNLPTSLLVKDDGSIIVAVKPISHSTLHACVLIEFDHDRIQRSARTLRGEFMIVSGLAFSTYSSQVCTADMEYRVVHVLPNNTNRVLRYQRSSAFPIRRESGGLVKTQFSPRAVCSGLHDAFLVLDGGSGYIHVLDSFASLIGVVVMDDQENAGSPSTIAIGKDDRLWVGDASDGKIKVYSLNIFINHLQQEPTERGLTFNHRRFSGSGELNGTPSDVFGNSPFNNSVGTGEYVLGVGMDGNSFTVPKDTMHDMIGNHMPSIRIKTDLCGTSIVLDDTGTPEGNKRELERVLRLMQDNSIIRNGLGKHGYNVDNFGPNDFKFESATDVSAHQSSFPDRFGNFSRTRFTTGSHPLQFDGAGINFFTGNRDDDLRLLDEFLKRNPFVREDMERKGITPEMIVDFQRHM